MNWTNIKRWAKDKGYKVDREKSCDVANPYHYEWYLLMTERHGTINSLSKMAMAIYNDITDNKHVEHQERYAQEQFQQEVDYVHHGENNKIKKQSITMSTIIGKAIEAVVAYVVFLFFGPVWDRL